MPKTPTRSRKPASRTGLSLVHPGSMSLVTPGTLLFKWTRPRAWQKTGKIRYVLRIYDDSQRLRASSVRRADPVYEAVVEDGEAFRFEAGKAPLVPGRLYRWVVTAYDHADKPLGASAQNRFGYRADFPVATPGPSHAQIRRGDFVPAAPHVWGCPVSRRFRTALDAPPVPATDEVEPGEPAGGVVPKGITWASPAAVVFLIPQTWGNCNLLWDHSGIRDCSRVILQMAAEPGFEYPSNSPDVLADPSVVAAFEGPANTFCSVAADHDLVRVGHPTQTYSTQAFNLLHNDLWDEAPGALLLRLVPLRADGTLADIASDPTYVFCLQEWPGIILTSFDVTWTWGESPRRVIDFELEMLGDFPPGFWGTFAVPTAFVVGAWPGGVTNVEMTVDGGPITRQSRIQLHMVSPNHYEAYVVQTDDWQAGRVYHGRLVQELEYVPPFCWTVQPLVDFIETGLTVKCFPGIAIDWAYCGGPMTAESCRLPQLASPPACGLPLHADVYPWHSAWDQIFAFFDSAFTGTRTVRTFEERQYPPEDGDVTDSSSWPTERDELSGLVEEVTILFSWPGSPRDGTAFRGSFLRSEPATMTETLGSTSRLYDFKWYAGGATLAERGGERRAYHGESVHDMGAIVAGIPDTLELHFQRQVDWRWDVDHSVRRYEVIDYVLHR